MHEDILTRPNPVPAQERTGKAWLWFGLFAMIAFCAEGLGYAACRLVHVLPPTASALLAFAVVAAVVGGVAALLMNWLVLDRMERMAAELDGLRGTLAIQQQMEQQLATRAELQRRLRHDLRGALSPALLTADRLISHEDPKVRRAGEIMVKSVDRASALLADPAEAGGSPQ